MKPPRLVERLRRSQGRFQSELSIVHPVPGLLRAGLSGNAARRGAAYPSVENDSGTIANIIILSMAANSSRLHKQDGQLLWLGINRTPVIL